MWCPSCYPELRVSYVICQKCYKKDREIKESLNRQIEHLTAILSFLRLPSRPFHDIVLVASGDSSTVPANRSVLAGCSPVFRAMLDQNETIEIGDASYNTLKKFVDFLYTAEAADLDEDTGFHLLALADKYQVSYLKTYCEKFLMSALTDENAVSIYRFARKHNVDYLLDECLSRISVRNLHAHVAEEDLHMATRVYERFHTNRENAETPYQLMRLMIRDKVSELKCLLWSVISTWWSNESRLCLSCWETGLCSCQLCKSCGETQKMTEFTGGNCIFCHDRDGEIQKKLKSQAEDLSSAVSLLRSSWLEPPPPSFSAAGFIGTLLWSDGVSVSPRRPNSDVTLVASDDPSPRPPITANRTVLAGRSPVFRAMLESEMEESVTGIIKIGGASYDAIREFVRFLYTAEANDLDEKMACELLVLGDIYQVPYLKNYCEKFLISNLNWENSLPLYAFAHQHRAQSLLSDCLGVLVKDMHKLPHREDYAHFLEKDPRMMLQIYRAYSYN